MTGFRDRRLQGKDCSYNPFAFPPSLEVRCRRYDSRASIVPTMLLHFLRPWRSDGGGRAKQEPEPRAMQEVEQCRSNCRAEGWCNIRASVWLGRGGRLLHAGERLDQLRDRRVGDIEILHGAASGRRNRRRTAPARRRSGRARRDGLRRASLERRAKIPERRCSRSLVSDQWDWLAAARAVDKLKPPARCRPPAESHAAASCHAARARRCNAPGRVPSRSGAGYRSRS